MSMSEMLVHEHSQERLRQARESMLAQQLAGLRRLYRARQRAEARLSRVRQRAAAARSALSAG